MSFSKTYTAQVSGLDANIIGIEVDLSNGLHSFSIVGLGDRAVEEAKDRISAAIKNSGFTSPKQKNQKVVISLAPADIRKEGTTFDLGMAMAYLLASGDVHFNPEKMIFIGELSLEGNLNGTRGTLAMIRTAKEKGFNSAFVPCADAEEAALITDMKIYAMDSLRQTIEHVTGKKITRPRLRTKIMAPKRISAGKSLFENDFGFIRGQENAKRALEIAAAGKHNVAMYGPPGTGKTMLAKAFAGILPILSYKEVLEVTEIHSIVRSPSQGESRQNIIKLPPFRAPHHTSPYSAIIGGGGSPRPGEITLAHHGVIFLDEFTEFDRRTIDSLRQPMEEKSITITRTKGSATYPADCIYILAMNPCACGGKRCVCTEKEITRYRKKISGPIADRIDIWISVSNIEYDEFLKENSGVRITSETLARQVKEARTFGKNRNKNYEKDDIDPEAFSFMAESAKKLELSGRAYTRTFEVARTIADLSRSIKIKREHVMEALQYRRRD